MKSVFLIAIVAVAMIGVMIPNVFAEYEIDNVCEWAKLNSQLLWPIDIVKDKFSEDLPLQDDIYQNLLRENYEEWEIESGSFPIDIAYEFLDQSKFIRNEYAVDKTIEFFDINPELKSLLLPRYNTSTWDEYTTQSFIVDYMLHPNFYGNNQKCEQEFIEENWERFSYLLIDVYGENRADTIYEEIEKKVYGDQSKMVIDNNEEEITAEFTKNKIQWKGDGGNITVQTDKPIYQITDIIRIFGYVNDFNGSEPLEINIFQNGKIVYNKILGYSGAAEYFRQGYFSVIISPEYHPISFDWSGQYTVEVIHQQQKATTIFSFVGIDTFGGLYSISQHTVLQIDKKNYDLKSEIMNIHVSGIVKQSTSGMGDELEFQIKGPDNFTLKESKKWSGPIPLPENIGKIDHNNIVKKTEVIFQIDPTWKSGKYSISINNGNVPKIEFTVNNLFYNIELATCGQGTIEKNGQCIPDPNYKTTKSSKGGGCLIATASYGSELAPQVQQLRELRDNQLLQTESGTAFMSTFNNVYYSFSPIIADYERENPYFKEAVKIAITPMISTLSLMENANSESEVLSIGISVIMLNLGMYLGVPAVVIVGIKRKF